MASPPYQISLKSTNLKLFVEDTQTDKPTFISGNFQTKDFYFLVIYAVELVSIN
jgi:hypothetical protein